jgi:hypothetical protein
MKYWGPWETNMQKSTNSRMIHQLVFHTQQTIRETSTQDLDPLPLTNNDHTSVLLKGKCVLLPLKLSVDQSNGPYDLKKEFEMYALEGGEPPTRTLNWNPLGFLSHIQCRTNDDRFPLSLWEVWFALPSVAYSGTNWTLSSVCL